MEILSGQTFVDFCLVVLSIHFIVAIRSCLLTLRQYDSDLRMAGKIIPSNSESGNETHIFLPFFHEGEFAESAVREFANEFVDANVTIYACAHHSDTQTILALTKAMAAAQSPRVKLVTNHSNSHSKAAQLNAALSEAGPELCENSLVSVYDCDSVPDRRILTYLREWRSGALSEPCSGAVQQAPFYPLNQVCTPFELIAQARAIHSLVYHYCYEHPAYLATQSRAGFGMSIHLTGHGEHILFSALKSAGGFREPSCNSSLGFSLSYLGYTITPIPLPDVSQTPTRIFDIWNQGLRWYRGCDLYYRELQRLGRTAPRVLQALMTCWNNVRWFAIGPIMLLTGFMEFTSVSFTAVTNVLVGMFAVSFYVRHLLMLRAYRQLAGISRRDVANQQLWKWASYQFLAYVMLRLIWSLIPLYYYFLVLLGRPLSQETTPKSEQR